jgi:hypothetical protein
MTRIRLTLFAALAGFAGTIVAQDDEPDLGFLEYLGSWEEGDDEWLIVAEIDQELDEKDEASDEDEQTDETEQK